MLETPLHTQRVQTEWSRLLLGSFAEAGVTDVVVSPGSRSTPLVLAAARESRLRLWDVVDERAAAYFALGQARLSGRPSLVLCTSGTALANHLPAVVEAGAAGVPLLILSADRPLELQDCGANQTIDQTKIFGDRARLFVDLGHAEAAPRSLRALRRRAAQAVFAATHPTPGAVHLNARLCKPLEPPTAETPVGQGQRKGVDHLLSQPLARPTAPRLEPDPAAIERLAKDCLRAERGLIVCGPAPIARCSSRWAILDLAARLGFPIVADAASQLRLRGARGGESSVGGELVCLDAFDAFLRVDGFRHALRPDCIVQIGTAPTSSRWEGFLEDLVRDDRIECPHWVIAAHGWNDPASTATDLIFADVGPTVDALHAHLDRRGASPSAGLAWCDRLRGAETAVRRVMDAELRGERRMSEASAARAVVDALPDGGLLALGNSLPIRHVDLWCPGPGRDLAVWSQRGASGIDGVIAGAAGAASLAGGPAALLVGDVSALHDQTGWQALRHVEVPFAVVILHNQGGRIFEMLPLARHPDARGTMFNHWTTPHRTRFHHAAMLHGLPCERVRNLRALRTALTQALKSPGASVIEAMVPEDGAAEQSRRLTAEVGKVLGGG